MADRQLTGMWGEAQAEAYLQQRGFALLHRRYRKRGGEIDLVMQDGDTIVFVEVKTRRGTGYGTAAEAVTTQKQQAIRHAAQLYLQQFYQQDFPVRFDVVEVYLPGPRICHIPDAF